MSECLFRLVLVGVIFVTLFLPWNRVSDSMGVPTKHILYEGIPTFLFIVWVTLETLPTVIRGIGLVYSINGLCIVLFLWAIPFLMPFNVGLAVCPFEGLTRWLKVLYRIFLLIVLALAWHAVFLFYRSWRGAGFWSSIAAVSVAVLIEIVLVISEWLKKPQGARSIIE